MLVTKLDVIEQHLTTSVQMIAIGASAISTHVIVKACEEMIASVANSKGVFLDWDYKVFIKDEFHELWRRKTVEAYNFFKHADRDPTANYDDPSLEKLDGLNELLTLICIKGHQEIGGPNIPILTEYSVVMSLMHPDLFKLGFLDQRPEFKHVYESVRDTSPGVMKSALLLSLYQKGMMPKIPPI